MRLKYKDKESEFIFGEKDYLVGEKETFNNFKKSHIQKELMKIREEMRLAAHDGDEERAESLQKKQQVLENERDSINNSRYSNN